MSSAKGWTPLHDDAEGGVRVFTLTADTHDELGQTLLSDPLSAVLDSAEELRVAKDKDWAVQLHLVNAQIPSGPLPLPRDIPPPPEESSWWPWVIRKIIIIVLIFDDLNLVLVIVRRSETNRETALGNLKDSLEGRAGEP
ncbi:MAG TPA: hypothetical protein VJN72_10895 [Gaiellales bacterium]|nr:hypothetical protein [Gaiellales bacterium]